MAEITRPKRIIVYKDKGGNEPFTTWLDNLRDLDGKRRIAARITRLQSGLYGDCEPVGEGENDIVILLCGGDKSTQKKDIKTAKEYWQEYKENERRTELQNI